ncbi:MAG TPA: tRNA 2-selenouridine(34) synthase MnmH [Hanamia sp.]|nr:tRNA 2-selenouridine(34) synthase MnmH [Hanamia sp.]
MPIEKINIDHFLSLSEELPIIDVRSPGEYNHAHIPGAYSVPVFTDEQRAIIGTAYLQENRQTAVNHGLNYFSERMRKIPEEIINIIMGWKMKEDTPSSDLKHEGILIHCWRGGMRSEAVAWLMNLYGYKIYLLNGGYKSFRRWASAQFEKKYSLKVLGGFTGSGKTQVLNELKRQGKKVINLEDLANHKGSAFGTLGEKPQPSHEMFENILAKELNKISNNRNDDNGKNINEIWIEDESIHIGKVGIPKIFWEQMRASPLFFLDIPFEPRVNYISNTYGGFDKKDLIECILKIQKRLGGLDTKNTIHYISENNFKEGFAILLKYYDKQYAKSLENRENLQSLLNKVACKNVDISNTGKLLIQ